MTTPLQAFDSRNFVLAATTEQVVLARVQAAIRNTLAAGELVSSKKNVNEILTAAGVHPSSPSYAENVTRTNMMAAFQSSADSQRQDPDVINSFPVWRWDAIADGRCRPSHWKHHGKYYPSTVTLPQVRDVNGFDGYQERCTSTPIFATAWKRLKAAGARVADGYFDPTDAALPAAATPKTAIPLTPTIRDQLPPDVQANTLQDLTATPQGREWAASNKTLLRSELLPPAEAAPDLPHTLPIPEPKAKSVKAADAKEVLPDGRTITFIRHEIGAASDKLIWVDVAKLDAAWRGDSDYLPIGRTVASEIPGRRVGFAEFLAKGRPIQAPRITLDADGKVSFTDGRHRVAVLRDAGAQRIAVMVRSGQAAKVEALLG